MDHIAVYGFGIVVKLGVKGALRNKNDSACLNCPGILVDQHGGVII